MPASRASQPSPPRPRARRLGWPSDRVCFPAAASSTPTPASCKVVCPPAGVSRGSAAPGAAPEEDGQKRPPPLPQTAPDSREPAVSARRRLAAPPSRLFRPRGRAPCTLRRRRRRKYGPESSHCAPRCSCRAAKQGLRQRRRTAGGGGALPAARTAAAYGASGGVPVPLCARGPCSCRGRRDAHLQRAAAPLHGGHCAGPGPPPAAPQCAGYPRSGGRLCVPKRAAARGGGGAARKRPRGAVWSGGCLSASRKTPSCSDPLQSSFRRLPRPYRPGRGRGGGAACRSLAA